MKLYKTNKLEKLCNAIDRIKLEIKQTLFVKLFAKETFAKLILQFRTPKLTKFAEFIFAI